MLAALSEFRAELLEDADGRCDVVIVLGGDDREILAILNALERHVTARASGPARLELGGHSYVMQPNRGSEIGEDRSAGPAASPN
jgi:hypothetical protein